MFSLWNMVLVVRLHDSKESKYRWLMSHMKSWYYYQAEYPQWVSDPPRFYKLYV